MKLSNPRHDFYAYALAPDETRAKFLAQKFEEFVQKHEWTYSPVIHVNDGLVSEDGEIGLNYRLPAPESEEDDPEGIDRDLRRIISECARLYLYTDVEFVLGIGSYETGMTEDTGYVESGRPDVDELVFMAMAHRNLA